MTTGIDISRSPYFDSFDANSNYYQVLYRPAVAVQTRELNEIEHPSTTVPSLKIFLPNFVI